MTNKTYIVSFTDSAGEIDAPTLGWTADGEQVVGGVGTDASQLELEFERRDDVEWYLECEECEEHDDEAIEVIGAQEASFVRVVTPAPDVDDWQVRELMAEAGAAGDSAQ